MTTIKINDKSKQAKAIIAMLRAFDFVEFISSEKIEEKNTYNPDFEAKMKKAMQEIKEGKTTLINPDDVWGSIGLK